jgi:CheY-like chemotaxis protein
VNQKLVRELLKKLGHRPTIGANGEEALRALKNRGFDFDPDGSSNAVMSGAEVTRKIREAERNSRDHMPIIAMTAHAASGDRERAMQTGMDDYLAKPIRLEHLRRVIQQHAPAPDIDALLQGVGGDRSCCVSWWDCSVPMRRN